VTVRDLNRTPGVGLGNSRAYRGDRSFDRRVDRRRDWRGDRSRHRRVYRDGFYVYPYAGYAYAGPCHRHFRGARVMRHCHDFVTRHRHGGWR